MMLPKGSRIPIGTAQEKDVPAGETFMSGGSFKLKTGTMPDYAGTSPFHVGWVGGYPGQIRIQLPTGRFEENNPSEQVFILDANYDGKNIAAGKEVFDLPGTFTADATATAADIAVGKTAGINGEMVTGTMQPTAFAPSKQTAQVNASAFNQSGDSYVLLFNTIVPDVNDNLLGLSITFMTDGDAAWEYESGKNFNVTAMSFSVMVVNGELAANQQTIDLGSVSMTINIGNADISGGILNFDVVFTPSAGTFTINNNTPMISVDIWSY